MKALNTKKTILIVASTFPRWKGDKIPAFIYELAVNLLNYYDVHVLAPHDKNAKLFEEMNGVKVYRFPYFVPNLEKLAYGGGALENMKKNPLVIFLLPFYSLSNIIYLGYLYIRFKYHIINVHWLIPSGFLALFLKAIFRFKLVITSHGGDIYGFTKNKLMSKLQINKAIYIAIKFADKITVVSSAIKSEAVARFSGLNLEEKITVIPMGIELTKFNGKPRTDAEIPSKLLFVGRLSEKKGVEYLIRALRILKDKNEAFNLTIAGDGSERDKLEALTSKLGLNEDIKFIGAYDNKNLINFFNEHDIFIGPSVEAQNGDKEGLPVTFMEAMAGGIPAVVSNTPGVTDLITNGHDGLIVEQKNPEQIAEAVLKLKNDFELRNQISQNAIITAQNYNWKNIVKKYYELFEKD